MRWIADTDRKRIEDALNNVRLTLGMSDGDKERLDAVKHLLIEVLRNIERLEKEQPDPEPRIVPLAENELRKIYPERYS